MTTLGDNYILPGLTDHDRLRVISEIHDGATRQLLDQAGFFPGCRFVEFGCGLGYVTRWAATEGAYATGLDGPSFATRAYTSLVWNRKVLISRIAAG
jgi:hypothetical protein